MMDPIKNLPLPAKIAGVTVIAGSLVVAGRTMSARALGIILLGLLIAALLIGVYFLVRRYFSGRRAAGMGGQIAAHSTVAPRSISDPAARAKLDNLRQTFQRGLDKFRAAGKDLYSLPWYMVVGEPGSGKTEAIRHCNVGFPPGLQDELQGAGGTINMNWWFTNYSVILDTAGRLMFEDVAPGTTSEWREFLGLLRSRRPNCPINGLILVIPVDSLIKDSADEIAHKASRIAQQFSTIQGALDVRFPVFVLITKTDLINGFREFFEHVKDPHLQHQMMGWSNPDPLDQAFRPDLVDKHIEQVVTRIRRRRFGLMQDPTPQTDFATGRRLDDVDALFALPSSLQLIAPRLRRYLEMVFMPNEWSGKPLFLRGIYFTSAMREGSALDQELAEAIGVSVDSLPEGKTWERESAYFLRDLFLEKIFREKGLVTRATNTRAMLRRQKAVLVGTVSFLLVALGVWAWVGSTAVRDSVGRELDYWRTASEGWQDGAWRPIVAAEFKNSPDFLFNGSQEVIVGGERITLAEYHRRLADLVSQDIKVPFIFRPMSGLFAGTNSGRKHAQRVVFEGGVVKPMVDAGRFRLERTADHWTPYSSATLALLVRLEGMIQYRSSGLSSDELAADAFFSPLGGLLFGDPRPDPALARTFEWTYVGGGDGRGYWPPRWLSGGANLRENKAIDVGLTAFLSSAQKAQQVQETGFEHLKSLRIELLALRKTEEALARTASQPNSSDDAIKAAADTYLQVKSQYDLAVSKAAQSGIFRAGGIVMFEAYSLLIDETRKQTEQATKELQVEIDRFGGDNSGGQFTLGVDIRRRLQAIQSQMKARVESSFSPAEIAELQALDKHFLERTASGEQLIDVRSELYGLAAAQINHPGGAVDSLVGSFTKAVDGLNSSVASARDRAGRYQGAFAVELGATMRRLLDYAQTRGLEALYDRYASEIETPLRRKAGFPLIRDSARVMSIDDFRSIEKLMRDARSDLPALRASRPASRSTTSFDVIEDRVRRLSAVGEALIGENGSPGSVALLFVSYKDQQAQLKRQLGVESVAGRWGGTVWRSFRVNSGAKVKTEANAATEFARIGAAEAPLQVDFFTYVDSVEPARSITMTSPWAVLQLLHESNPRRLPSGREWEATIVLKDDQQQDRFYLIQLQFEKPLPDLDLWPTSTRLGL